MDELDNLLATSNVVDGLRRLPHDRAGEGFAVNSLTIKEMKDELRRLGVPRSRLDRFLDRESLADFHRIAVGKVPGQASEQGMAHQGVGPVATGLTPVDRRAPWGPPEGVSQVAFLGERHSGLHWAASLVHLNLRGWTVVEPFARHALLQPLAFDFPGANKTLVSAHNTSIAQTKKAR